MTTYLNSVISGPAPLRESPPDPTTENSSPGPLVAHLDLESLATVDLKNVGAWNYSKHEDTCLTCFAYKLPGQYVKAWVPWLDFPWDLWHHIVTGGLIKSFNALFEICMWMNLCVPHYGFPEIKFGQWRCSAADAARAGLPRDLDSVTKILDTPTKKDGVGKALMHKMCKPRGLNKDDIEFITGVKGWKGKALAAEKERVEREYGPFWALSRRNIMREALYCGRDVLAEYGIGKKIPPLDGADLEQWQLVTRLNLEGVRCDLDMARNALHVIEVMRPEAMERLNTVTDGHVQTVNQHAKIKEWVLAQGYPIENIQKQTVEEALLDSGCTGGVREVLELRRAFGGSSVSKYSAMVHRADPDDWRVRGHLRYHGAHTGRHAGEGIQTQNFPQPPRWAKAELIERATLFLLLDNPRLFSVVVERYTEMLVALLRPTIRAEEGYTLYSIDYSSIEAVLVLWFCDDPAIEEIREGLCVYKSLAGVIYDLDDPQSLDKRHIYRTHGKLGVLSCGYRMWVYGLLRQAKGWGLDLDYEMGERIVLAYRDRHEQVVKMWTKLERLYIKAMGSNRKVKIAKGAYFQRCGEWLHVGLPSGRIIRYHKPRVGQAIKYGRIKTVLYHRRWKNQKWVEEETHGGTILENIVQGMAADLLAGSLLRISKRPKLGRVRMNVHDEGVFEVRKNSAKKAYEEACKEMTTPPVWGPDIPLRVSGWIGDYYRYE